MSICARKISSIAFRFFVLRFRVFPYIIKNGVRCLVALTPSISSALRTPNKHCDPHRMHLHNSAVFLNVSADLKYKLKSNFSRQCDQYNLCFNVSIKFVLMGSIMIAGKI